MYSYVAPTEHMDLNTTQRFSYKIVNLPKKENTPWADKLDYCKPQVPLECRTIYDYR